MTCKEILKKLGMPQHLKGYRYWVKAFDMVSEDESLLEYMGRFYLEVAEACGTTGSRVERALRHSVEVAFDRSDPDTISELFGGTLDPRKDKPTNSEFLHMVYDTSKESAPEHSLGLSPDVVKVLSDPKFLRWARAFLEVEV